VTREEVRAGRQVSIGIETRRTCVKLRPAMGLSVRCDGGWPGIVGSEWATGVIGEREAGVRVGGARCDDEDESARGSEMIGIVG
jgi:hypothetical protein